MPSALTHYLFNSHLIKDEKYSHIFLLAGQGADTLFFYGYTFLKRKNAKLIRQKGYDIHSINPDKLYMKMLSLAFNEKGENKEILLNFVRGFMYHYALDRNVHPYIFYNGGFPYTTKKYNLNHGRLESIIDTLLMKEEKCHKSTRSILKAKSSEVKLCSKLVASAVNDIFNDNVLEDDSYYKAYKDYRFVRLIVDSKFGIKKFFFNLFMKDSSINTISQPRVVKDTDKYDYLNNSHRNWVIPCSGEVVNYSIKDLFLKAEEDCRIIDTIIYNYKNNYVTEKKISNFTKNINHDGRNLDKFMTYFKIIWK